MIKLNNFKLDEFKCPCCGEAKMQDSFLTLIDLARTTAGIPFVITSGYRCEKHNKEVKGKPNSAHLRGYAADIRCIDGATRFKLINALLKVGFKRIGIADSFVHCDNDPSLPQEVIWKY